MASNFSHSVQICCREKEKNKNIVSDAKLFALQTFCVTRQRKNWFNIKVKKEPTFLCNFAASYRPRHCDVSHNCGLKNCAQERSGKYVYWLMQPCAASFKYLLWLYIDLLLRYLRISGNLSTAVSATNVVCGIRLNKSFLCKRL